MHGRRRFPIDADDTMAWLMRIFGIKHDDAGGGGTATATATANGESVPIERQGLSGEYDQSGLAKRVVKAFDDAGVEDAPHLYVAQHDTTIVFKGNVHNQAILDQVSEIARGVAGCTAVDGSEVKVGG